MDDSPSMEQDPPKPKAERLGEIVAIPLVLVLIAGAVVLLIGLFQGPKIDPGRDPGFLETIFASRGTVGMVRVAIVFAAAYLIISVCALIANQQWLTRVGPVEVAQSVKGLIAERDQLAAELTDAREAIDHLEDRLIETTQAYEEAAETLAQALAYIDTIESERGT
jgi:hypothetical protein